MVEGDDSVRVCLNAPFPPLRMEQDLRLAQMGEKCVVDIEQDGRKQKRQHHPHLTPKHHFHNVSAISNGEKLIFE